MNKKQHTFIQWVAWSALFGRKREFFLCLNFFIWRLSDGKNSKNAGLYFNAWHTSMLIVLKGHRCFWNFLNLESYCWVSLNIPISTHCTFLYVSKMWCIRLPYTFSHTTNPLIIYILLEGFYTFLQKAACIILWRKIGYYVRLREFQFKFLWLVGVWEDHMVWKTEIPLAAEM